jgi:HTH-like domain/Integrase core domain
MTILPCPIFPLAIHASLGQNVSEAFIGSVFVFISTDYYGCVFLHPRPPSNVALPLRATPSVKFWFIHEHRQMFPLIRMCHVLGVSENGYNNWRKRGKSQRKQHDELLMERIEDAYHQNRGHYGSPRIHAELKTQGVHCARKRVARLMREQQLSARKKKRKVRTTNSNHQFPIAPNLLEQDFTASAPNTKWLTDFTFIETREGWLYLAGVLDAYSRKIVGWSMSEHHNAELVQEAIRTPSRMLCNHR